MSVTWFLCLIGVAAVYSLPVPEDAIVQVYETSATGRVPSFVEVLRVKRNPEPIAFADPDPRHHHHHGHGGYGGYGGYGGGYGGYGGGYGRPSGYGHGGYGGYPGYGGGGGYGGSNSQASASSFSGGFNGPFGGAGFSGSSAQASSGSGYGYGR